MKPIPRLLAVVTSLLLLCRHCQAGTVELVNVDYFPYGSNLPVDQERHYRIKVGNLEKYTGWFMARRAKGSWMLEFRWDKNFNGSLAEGEEDEITGKNGVLWLCLDKFLADIPDAKVMPVYVDMRASRPLWSGFKTRMLAFLKKTPDALPLFDGEGLNPLWRDMDQFLAKSEDAKQLAQKIADKLGRKVENVEFDWDNGIDDSLAKVKMSELALKRDFGLSKPPVMKSL